MTTHGPSNYAARRNHHGQTEIIRAAEYHRPHIRVSWYWAGMGQSGTCAVHANETHSQAADRAFPVSIGAKSRDTYPVVWAA